MPYDTAPQEAVDLYNLDNVANDDSFACIDVQGGVCGLPQSGKLAHDELVQNLKRCSYEPAPRTPGLWINKKQIITLTLVVDDFGVKHSSPRDLNHSIASLRGKHVIAVDHGGGLCAGATSKWNYRLREANCSTSACYPPILKWFKRPTPTTPQRSPRPAPNIACGKSVKHANIDDAPKIGAHGVKQVQSIVGSTLCGARLVGNPTLVAANEVGLQQANIIMSALNP